MESKSLLNQEFRRYKRQIELPGIGELGQSKLKRSKVLVIGAGGMGSSALQYLAASGVGELGICDNKIIEEENFQNHVLFNNLDLGKQKAIIAKLKLEEQNNFNHYSVLNIFICPENVLKICSDFEIVINATNNPQVGLPIDEACFQLEIPLIYTEKNQHGIKISVFNYLRGPRFLDFFKANQYDPSISNDKNKYGTFGVVDGIIGNIMALEALKIITGIGKVLSNKMLIIDPINLIIEYQEFN